MKLQAIAERSIFNKFNPIKNRIYDKIAFGIFYLIAVRKPNDEEYFASRTRRQLLGQLRK